MNAFSKIWNDVFALEDAMKHINEEKKEMEGKQPSNLEDKLLV